MPIFDNSLRPQDDFFGYVNNNWLKNNPIPSDESTWGTFYVLRNKSSEAIKKIIDEISIIPDDKLSYDQKLLKTYFSTALNFSKYRCNHLKTISDELQNIKNIKNISQLSNYIGYANRLGFEPFWLNYVSLDDKNSQIKALHIHQSGISLPNRDYYLDNTSNMKKIRKEYKKYFQTIYNQIPEYSSNIWKNVFDIELKLAKSSWTEIKLRNIDKNYNKFTIKELQLRFPKFDWIEYFKGQNWVIPNDNIIISQPSFIDEALKIINEYPLEKIKEYLSWCVINDLYRWVDKNTAKINFDFYGKIIEGKVKNKTLWKRAVNQADNLIIGEALGREYALRHFPESSKQAVIEMVEDIRTAYHKRINEVIWMKDNTKKTAHKKLDNMKILIGYPSKWQNLNKLIFSNNNHIENILSAQSLKSDIEFAKIGKKPESEEWHMNAHTVNAYNDLNQLVVCFPAGILQPPFYDLKSTYAKNLGGIGAVIGHEFTHGFDDQGAQFDELGNTKNWQTKQERKLFKDIAKNIIKQANNYEVLPKLFLKGELILGEAIADIGGLELAIEALHLKNSSKDIDKSIQELFVNAAIFECGHQRKEHLICQAKTDPHPPSKYRVNCVVPHINAFYDSFNVKPGDKLYLPPEERVHIW